MNQGMEETDGSPKEHTLVEEKGEYMQIKIQGKDEMN
jgi:hypothetical protein